MPLNKKCLSPPKVKKHAIRSDPPSLMPNCHTHARIGGVAVAAEARFELAGAGCYCGGLMPFIGLFIFFKIVMKIWMKIRTRWFLVGL